MQSWLAVIKAYKLPIPFQTSDIVTPPLPHAYSTMHSCRAGLVLESISQSSMRSIECNNVLTHPEWHQKNTWVHVSRTCKKLGRKGVTTNLSHLKMLALVAVMLVTCLCAESWKSLGTWCSRLCIISQSTKSNWSLSKILREWYVDCTNLRCAQYCKYHLCQPWAYVGQQRCTRAQVESTNDRASLLWLKFCWLSGGFSSVLSVLGCFPKFVFDSNLFIFFKQARAHSYQESVDFNIFSC